MSLSWNTMSKIIISGIEGVVVAEGVEEGVGEEMRGVEDGIEIERGIEIEIEIEKGTTGPTIVVTSILTPTMRTNAMRTESPFNACQ